MADKEREELKATVREAMNEILREMRPMPVPAPVTEIIIRVGASGALQTIGSMERRLGLCIPYGAECIPYCVESIPRLTRDDLDAETKNQLRLVVQDKEKRGATERQILDEAERRVLARLVSGEIKEEAAALEAKHRQEE